MTKKAFKQFQSKVQKSRQHPSFDTCPVAATLTGPCSVIEIIVADAVDKSGIPMDWGYMDGYATVRCKGNVKKARSALYCSLPQSELTIRDL
jgi:hypothetical protein